MALLLALACARPHAPQAAVADAPAAPPESARAPGQRITVAPIDGFLGVAVGCAVDDGPNIAWTVRLAVVDPGAAPLAVGDVLCLAVHSPHLLGRALEAAGGTCEWWSNEDFVCPGRPGAVSATGEPAE